MNVHKNGELQDAKIHILHHRLHDSIMQKLEHLAQNIMQMFKNM